MKLMSHVVLELYNYVPRSAIAAVTWIATMYMS